MSNIISGGRSVDLNVQAGQSLKVTTISGTYTATVLAGAGAGTALATDSADGATYGPYAAAVTIRIKSSATGFVDYDVGVSPSLGYRSPAYFGHNTAGDIASLVDGAGNEFGLYRSNSFLEQYGAHLYLAGSTPYEGNTVLATGDGGLSRTTELVGRIRDASNTEFPIAASNSTSAQKFVLAHDGTRYGWQCDGTLTRLPFASVPITDGSAPHFLISAFKMPASFGATGAPAGFGAAGSERLLISFNSGQMKPSCLWRDTAGTLQSLSPASNLIANEMVVVSMYLQGGTVNIRVRGSISGLQTASAASTQTAWTPTLGNIAGGVHAGATSFVWPGFITGVIAGMGSPTPTVEIVQMENLLAANGRFTLA